MQITPELLQQIEQMSRLGLSCKQVSLALGWDPLELAARRCRHRDVEAAWARGRGVAPAVYGRPPWEVTPQVLEKVVEMASVGLTIDQMARCLGTSATTFGRAKSKSPELQDAYLSGRARGVLTIANTLFDKARKGDTTAMIFFLKNRAPTEWMDRRKHEISSPDGEGAAAPLFSYTLVGGPGKEPTEPQNG